MAGNRPLILLTNDDGIRSPGLLAVAEAVCDLGDLVLVAPTVQQSGMGRSIPPVVAGAVVEERLTVHCQELPAYGLAGSPAQSVLYGVLVAAPRRPDLVISGINHGENLGTCVTVSGTVGAALQAAEMGIPGLAVSLETALADHYRHNTDVNWGVAAHTARYFAAAILSRQLPFDVDVLKIDVPATATPQTPWRITRQARQAYYETTRFADRPAEDPQVELEYRVQVYWDTLEPDSDIYAFVKDRVIAVTPLSQDLTSRVDFGMLARVLREAGG